MTARTTRGTATAVGLVLLGWGLSACGGEAEAEAAPLDPTLVKDGRLTVCTSLPYEPFEFKEKGEFAGFDIDLATAVAKRLKVRPVFVDTDFDGIASGAPLNAGTCDVAVAALTITGERARVVDFSSPYFDAAQTMVVPAGSTATSLDDLAGEKIGVQTGTTGELYVRDNAPSSVEVVTIDDLSEIAASMARGDIDAAFYDNTVVKDVLDENPDFEVAADFNTGEQYGMAVRKDGSTDLLRVINDVLAELVEKGRYADIYETWFGSAPPKSKQE
jgi:polar amino acid transport system substrate-binding protein